MTRTTWTRTRTREVVPNICVPGLHGWLDNAGTHDGLAARLPEGYRLVGGTVQYVNTYTLYQCTP